MQTGAAKELHTRALKTGLDVSDPALSTTFRRLADGGSEVEGVGWVLYGYDKDGADTSKCVVAATGTGAASLLAALREDQIFFGALRARVGGSSSDAAAAAPRLLSFLWVGPAVSPLRRGKAALHRNAVRDGAMAGGGVLRGEVSLWDEGAEAVVGEEELVARVRAALGAGVAAEGAVVLVLAS